MFLASRAILGRGVRSLTGQAVFNPSFASRSPRAFVDKRTMTTGKTVIDEAGSSPRGVRAWKQQGPYGVSEGILTLAFFPKLPRPGGPASPTPWQQIRPIGRSVPSHGKKIGPGSDTFPIPRLSAAALPTFSMFTPVECGLGGIALGLAATLKLVNTGRVLGISGAIKGLLGGDTSAWRLSFLTGLLGMGALTASLVPGEWHTSYPLVLLWTFCAEACLALQAPTTPCLPPTRSAVPLPAACWSALAPRSATAALPATASVSSFCRCPCFTPAMLTIPPV